MARGDLSSLAIPHIFWHKLPPFRNLDAQESSAIFYLLMSEPPFRTGSQTSLPILGLWKTYPERFGWRRRGRRGCFMCSITELSSEMIAYLWQALLTAKTNAASQPEGRRYLFEKHLKSLIPGRSVYERSRNVCPKFLGCVSSMQFFCRLTGLAPAFKTTVSTPRG